MPAGGFGGFDRQLKTRDAGRAPGDAAKAARRLEYEIVLLAGVHGSPVYLRSVLLARLGRNGRTSTRFLPAGLVLSCHPLTSRMAHQRVMGEDSAGSHRPIRPI